LSSRTRVKTLAYDTIVANARFFGGDLAKVPKLALTVGVGTVMEAREVVLLVTGPHKAYALYKVIEEGVSHMWTCSVLQNHQRSIIVSDEVRHMPVVFLISVLGGACTIPLLACPSHSFV
jgi:glucosamine-6-phosphate deaminase